MDSPTNTPRTLDEKLDLAERILGHRFADRDLLRIALTHPSAVEGSDPDAYYERLEFLGDAILGFLVADEVFSRYPHMPEGGMTRIRISLVNRAVLARAADELGLTEAIIVGHSMQRTGNRGLKSALGNMFEALVAALYLDAGMPAARAFSLNVLGPLISEDTATRLDNPKSDLQERLQARGLMPQYKTTGQEGPPHDRVFTVVVEVDGSVLGEGSGRTKREAEASAASAALDSLLGDRA